MRESYSLSSKPRELLKVFFFKFFYFAATWEVMTFNAPLQTPLASGETYKVRLDVTLQHAEVPPWLEKALFFWSWDIAPAASFTQEFTY